MCFIPLMPRRLRLTKKHDELQLPIKEISANLCSSLIASCSWSCFFVSLSSRGQRPIVDFSLGLQQGLAPRRGEAGTAADDNEERNAVSTKAEEDTNDAYLLKERGLSGKHEHRRASRRSCRLSQEGPAIHIKSSPLPFPARRAPSRPP